MSDFFKPSDFHEYYKRVKGSWPPITVEQAICDVANAKLRDCVVLTKQDIEKMPVVYGLTTQHPLQDEWSWLEQKTPADTHRARLFQIEEIKPKECEHRVDAKTFCKMLSPR